ncbi:hypothetical protein CIW83_05350 [Tissierella sp. P1]|uniref:hypothetical protein n=1 Tax=Tissierella sp. P1 TaxID=1280483 RepID=UPI000BA13581|nr:hypothetical protein [Tissierella sp. P1]OZV13300.1 hypothetical protein CIW83_05350 [Tissierella sp. P1]
MINCLYSEIKKFSSLKKILYILIIIIIPFTIQFLAIQEGYIYYITREIFEESIQGIISMLFPVLIMVVYANGYIVEYKNEYIKYCQSRVDIWTYIKSKLLANSIFTFIVGALIILIPYFFCQVIVPRYGLVELTPITEKMYPRENNLSFLLEYSSLAYILVYTIWVGINAVLYGNMAMLISLHKKNGFISLSIPVLFYHLGNFFLAVIGFEKFSPLASVFPLSLRKIWTGNFFVSFITLFIIDIVLFIYSYKKYKQFGDYYV